jgi:Tripartite tricarboxylate transporter TctB family
MALRIKSTQDFCSGCAFMAFGAVTVVLSQAHPMGTTARMGPGYFPTVLGALLAGIGLVVLLKSLTSADGGNVGSVHLWLLLRILLSVAAFAFLLHPLGLVLAAAIVVMLAAWAGHEFRVGEALINAVVLALLSYLLFVKGLNQTMPVWPLFFGA